METPRQLLGSSDRDFDSRSRISNASGTAEEAVLGFFPRMLMDRKGRLRKYDHINFLTMFSSQTTHDAVYILHIP